MNAISEIQAVLTHFSSPWLPEIANAAPASGQQTDVSGLGWPADLFADDVCEEPEQASASGTDWGSVWAGPRAEEASVAMGYRSPDLFEPAHIFLRADASDPASMRAAIARAAQVLLILRRDPKRFDELARAVSECPSSVDGGRLGAVLLGDVTAEFARVMRSLQPGQLCSVIVHTGYGVHIIRLDDRIPGRRFLPATPGDEAIAPVERVA